MPPSPILFLFLFLFFFFNLFPFLPTSALSPFPPFYLQPSLGLSPTAKPRKPTRFRHQSRSCAAPAPSPDAVCCIRQPLPCCTPFQLLQPLQPRRLSAAHQLRPPRITRKSVAQLADCEAIRKSKSPPAPLVTFPLRLPATHVTSHFLHTIARLSRPAASSNALCLSFPQGCRSALNHITFVAPRAWTFDDLFAGFHF